MSGNVENTAAESNSPDSAAGPPPGKGRHGWIWFVLIAVLGVGGFFLSQRRATGQSPKPPAWGPPPGGVPATVATARKGDIRVYVNALGTVIPVYTVSVTSRVQGAITDVYYREGQMVKKGDPLLDIDPRPYEAALTQTEGQLAHDQALLGEARIDLERYRAAFSRNAIAKQQLDDQEQTVLQIQGTVKNDEGQVANAKVNLVYCHITSPINGRVGFRLVDPGNNVQANSSTTLVVITQLQPITVVFSVAEDYLPQIQQHLAQGQVMAVDAFDRSQEKKIASGSLLTLDNQIDTTTGTLRLKALFPNQDSALFPNQFVNAKLLVDTQHGAIMAPSAAIQRNSQGAFVYVVKPDQTASIRTVTTGATDGSDVAVEGLQPGETVVTSGFDKMMDGVKVAVSHGAGGPGQSGAGAGGAGWNGAGSAGAGSGGASSGGAGWGGANKGGASSGGAGWSGAGKGAASSGGASGRQGP